MSEQTYQLTIIPNDKVVEMDRIAIGYQNAIANTATSGFAREMLTAQAMSQLRALMTPEVMKPVMELMNSELGFLTDRDPRRGRWNREKKCYEKVEPYTEEVVRDCLISGRLQDLSWVGNQLNIISGKCYTTKNGLTALLKKLKGLQNLVVSIGVPRLMTGGAVVQVSATWTYNGVKGSLVGLEGKNYIEIPVKVNDQMGSDAIIGKAERKAKARIYAQITGSEVAEGEIDGDVLSTAKPVGPGVSSTPAGSVLDGLGGQAQRVAGEPLPQPADAGEPIDVALEEGTTGTPVSEPPHSTAEATPPPAAETAPAAAPAAPAAQEAAQPAGQSLAREIMARLQKENLSAARFMEWATRSGFAKDGAQSPLDIPEKDCQRILNGWKSVAGICPKTAAKKG